MSKPTKVIFKVFLSGGIIAEYSYGDFQLLRTRSVVGTSGVALTTHHMVDETVEHFETISISHTEYLNELFNDEVIKTIKVIDNQKFSIEITEDSFHELQQTIGEIILAMEHIALSTPSYLKQIVELPNPVNNMVCLSMLKRIQNKHHERLQFSMAYLVKDNEHSHYNFRALYTIVDENDVVQQVGSYYVEINDYGDKAMLAGGIISLATRGLSELQNDLNTKDPLANLENNANRFVVS